MSAILDLVIDKGSRSEQNIRIDQVFNGSIPVSPTNQVSAFPVVDYTFKLQGRDNRGHVVLELSTDGGQIGYLQSLTEGAGNIGVVLFFNAEQTGAIKVNGCSVDLHYDLQATLKTNANVKFRICEGILTITNSVTI